MAILPVQDSGLAAITPAPSALNAGGDSFPNNGHVVLEVINGGGVAITVTADDLGTPTPAGTLAAAFDPNVTTGAIAAGQRRIWGPFPPFRFNDANGRVNLTYSVAPTGVTIGFYRTRSS